MPVVSRFIRICFNIAAALSLAVCVLVACLWIKCPSSNHHTLHYVSPFDSSGDSWAVDASMLNWADEGKVIIFGSMRFRSDVPRPDWKAGWDCEFNHRTRLWSWVFGYVGVPRDPEASYSAENGFAFVVSRPADLTNGLSERCRFVMVPAWFVVTFASTLPIVWVIVFVPPVIRRRWRMRRGHCTACGYDLRGTAPDRACPECGAARTPSAMTDASATSHTDPP